VSHLPKTETILSEELRKQLAESEEIGCGNFLHVAVKVNPNADKQFIWMDKPVTTYRGETFDGFSLTELKRVSDEYAAWYYGNGVREKDPVAVYIEEGIINLVHFVALTGLGAIPILINGNMKPATAAAFIKKSRAAALFTDGDREIALSPNLDRSELRFVATDELAATMEEPVLPTHYPYHHDDKDPVLVGHSSGTTGIPKAVIFEHQQFFHGPRYRLGLPFPVGSERIMSALPHSHSAGLAYVMLAVLNGNSTLVLTTNQPETVLSGVENFRPSVVVAFPETYVELCQHDFSKHDMSSIRVWINGGDAAHETHIRRLISVGTRNKDGKEVPGSIFIDGLGSSEMGFSLFRMVQTPDSAIYNRCIGTALEWVDAAIIGENGEKLSPFKVGKLGVRSPSITPGYWNDSILTARARVHGYWLTGDLFYQDEQGRFFHVDRIPDAITTEKGMLYSLQTEEFLMRHFKELADCTIVGAPLSDSHSGAVALVRLNAGVTSSEELLLAVFNEKLISESMTPLKVVVKADPKSIPLGPTGKVLKRELRDQYHSFFVTKNASNASKKVSKTWAPTNVSA
jgi:acyl-coenzyme A synthetase/AMP-(fatty) acid ligase